METHFSGDTFLTYTDRIYHSKTFHLGDFSNAEQLKGEIFKKGNILLTGHFNEIFSNLEDLCPERYFICEIFHHRDILMSGHFFGEIIHI